MLSAVIAMHKIVARARNCTHVLICRAWQHACMYQQATDAFAICNSVSEEALPVKQVYSAVREGCWRRELQRACLEHAARQLHPRAPPPGSQRRPEGWRCRSSHWHAADAGCAQLRVRPFLLAHPLCSRSASGYPRQQSMLMEVTDRVSSEGGQYSVQGWRAGGLFRHAAAAGGRRPQRVLGAPAP